MKSQIFVALDFNDKAKAERLVAQLSPELCGLKVGKELFAAAGPAFVEQLVTQGFKVFLDLKYHDIPNTVAKAVAAAANMGVYMVNVHASGGRKMMQSAKQALIPFADRAPKLIAVTVLTSMAAEDLQEIGINVSPATQVERLAQLTQEAGLDGVVCSAQEAEQLKQKFGTAFLLVTPGIRPAGADQGDQKRVMTPPEAQAVGVDYLVIGRPITAASEPLQALKDIRQSLQG